MAGFAGFLGGIGNAAENIGAQIRPILEHQRQAYASMLSQKALEEKNPDYAQIYMKAAHDTLSGQPWNKILPPVIKVGQTIQQDHQALGQALQTLQPSQGSPQKTPGPQAGATPGTGFQNLLAAQPSTSPVSPQAQSAAKSEDIPGVGQMSTVPVEPPAPNPQASSAIPSVPPAVQQLAQQLAPMQGGQSQAPTPDQGQGIPPVTVTPPQDPQMAARQMREQIIQQAEDKKRSLPSAYWSEVDKDTANRLQGLQPFEDEARRKANLQNVLSSPEYKNHDYVGLNLVAQANGFQPVNTPMGMFVPHVVSPQVMGSQAPPGSVVFGTNNPLDPNTAYRHMMNMYTGQDMYMPMADQTVVTQTDNGQQITNKRNGLSIAPVAGGVAPGQNRMVNIGIGPEGFNRFSTAHRMESGLAPIVGGINVGALPTQSERTISTVENGQPVNRVEPFTTHRVLPGSGGGSIAPVGASPEITVPPGINGAPGFTLPAGFSNTNQQPQPGPQGRSFPKFDENQLTASGQKGVAAIDQVLGQISSLIPRMKEIGWDKDDTHSYYPDYVKAMHGGYASPLRDLYTGLNFEGIRSAAAALAGVNSRAYQIINRAMEHTPQLSMAATSLRASDTPKAMYQKLVEMQKILTDSRQNLMADEKKSGVIEPIKPATTPVDSFVDPALQGYADKYFGGDMTRAKAAVDSQNKAKTAGASQNQLPSTPSTAPRKIKVIRNSNGELIPQ